MTKRKPNDDPKSMRVEDSEQIPCDPVSVISKPVAIPSDEITVNKTEAPTEPTEAPPAPQLIPLKVFLAVSGKKPDQMAGFLYFANQEKLAPRSVKDWQIAYTKFMAQPVN